jgi:hypothetical protein
MPIERPPGAAAPRKLGVACVLAALVLPALWLLDASRTSPCGDGLCGFWEGLLIWGGLTTASLVFLVIGLARGEPRKWLALVALALLIAPVFVLAL